MRILYVVTKSELGGAQTHLLDLLRHFSRRHQVAVAAGQDGFLLEQARQLSVPAFLLRELVHPISLHNDARAVFAVQRLIRSFRPDLVHLHSSKAGIVGRLAARWANVPVLFTAHGWAFSDGASLKRRCLAVPVEWAASRIGGRIIDVSEYDRRLALRYGVGRPEAHYVVHNGVPMLPESAPGLHAGFVITMVARFEQQKNQAALIRALPLLPPEIRLKLIGDGPLRGHCEGIARQLGVSGRVMFVGNSHRVPAELAASDVFALISHYEGFPISILEAMRAGLPVLASPVGGVPEAVVHGETGLLVKDAEIAGALLRLHENHELRRSLGRAGRHTFEQRFTDRAMLSKIERVYRECVPNWTRCDGPDESLAEGAFEIHAPTQAS